MTLKLSHKAILLITVPFLFEVAFIATLVAAQHALEVQYEREFRAKDELSAVNAELRVMLEAGTSLGMYHATRDVRFLERFRQCHADLQKLQKDLASVTNQHRELDISEFAGGVEEVVATFDRMEALIKTGDRMDLMRSVFAGNAMAGKISKIGTAILAKSNAVSAAQRQREVALRAQQNNVILIGVIFNALIVVALGVIFHRGTTRRLNVLWQNAANLSQDRPLEEKLSGGDEIAAIDAGFHQMADALNMAKERELALTENAVDVICSFDKSGAIERINRAALDLWDYKAQELVGQSIFALINPSAHAVTAAAMLEATEHQCKPFEVTMLRRDGSDCVVQWALRWVEEEGSFFCVMHDITERKKIERLKQEVVAMVSHDLRSPLTALDMSYALLLEGAYGPIDERASAVLQKNKISVRRLIGMINTLLDMEKLDSGAIELSYSKGLSNDLINLAIDTVTLLAEDKGISFIVGKTNVPVYCDRDKILSVIVNLLSNAIKFSPDDSVIEIQSSKKEDSIEIRVIDQGRGVPPDKKDLIFERFKQSEKTDQSVLKGTGLGLAICKAIVLAHNGSIGVMDSKEGGSVFWFRLPGLKND